MDSQAAVVITTPRLYLRRFVPGDVDAIWEVERKPEVMRYERDGRWYGQDSVYYAISRARYTD